MTETPLALMRATYKGVSYRIRKMCPTFVTIFDNDFECVVLREKCSISVKISAKKKRRRISTKAVALKNSIPAELQVFSASIANAKKQFLAGKG